MRLGIVTQYFPPEIGAPQARLFDLARRFAERGHHVSVLTAMPNYPRGKIYEGYGGLFRREERDGVSVIRSYIYPTKSVKFAQRLTNYFSFVLSSLVAGTMALGRLDYLMTESPPLFLGVTGYLLSRLKNARWVFNVSDLWPDSAVRLGIVSRGLSLRLARALEAFCYRKAWLVTGQSEEILEDIRRRFPEVRTYHLSNGVDTHAFRPELRSPDTRRELLDGLSPGTNGCVAIYAGLHGVAQGLDQILVAAARLNGRSGPCFVFVGDGPEKERLLKQKEALGLTNIRFLEPLPWEAMPVLLASTDIALVPLKVALPGAVPSKVYEAMGAGVPVVLVAEGEASEIVRRSGAGVVVSPGDHGTLASVLRDLAEDSAKRRSLGMAGRQAALRHFDRASIARAFIGRLEEN